MADKAMTPLRRAVILFTISLGCESIYLYPYLRWTYYDQMLEAFAFTNTELTSLGSIFGVVAMVCYLFGGPLADKFSPKILLTLSYALAGVSGFVFASFPGYGVNVALYALWAVTTTLLMWNTMLRVTRTLGSSDEQGRLFGFLEGLRGVGATVLSFIMLAVFAALGSSVGGLQGVIITLAIIDLVVAVLAFIVVPSGGGESDGSAAFKLSDVAAVIKNPGVWVLAIVILSCYTVFSGLTYLTSYTTEIMLVPATAAAVIAVFRQYVCKMLGGPVGGFIADKITIPKVLLAGFVVCIVAVGALALLPSGTSIALIVAIIMVFAFVLMAMRGVYYACVDDIDIPLTVTGTAMGIISIIGFLPDIYFNMITGVLLDAFLGAQGYQYVFYVMIGFAVLGLLATLVLMRIINANKARKAVLDNGDQAGDKAIGV